MCAKFEAMRIKKKRERKRTFVKNYVVSKLTGRVNCNLCWRWCHLVAPLSCIICSFIAVRIWRIFFPFSRQRGTLINKKTVIKKALFIYLFISVVLKKVYSKAKGWWDICMFVYSETACPILCIYSYRKISLQFCQVLRIVFLRIQCDCTVRLFAVWCCHPRVRVKLCGKFVEPPDRCRMTIAPPSFFGGVSRLWSYNSPCSLSLLGLSSLFVALTIKTSGQ